MAINMGGKKGGNEERQRKESEWKKDGEREATGGREGGRERMWKVR